MTRLPRAHSGFGLIEVLVTLVVLMVGLLGLAWANNRANLAEMESYQRAQALLLLQDMADRRSANRQVAACYSDGTTGVQVGTGSTSSSTPACGSGTAQQQARVAADLNDWDGHLKGESETKSGTSVGAMIGAVGCVTQDSATSSVYMIAVSWQGLTPTKAPTLADGTPFACGNGLYGDEKLHRVITTKVQIGNLS